MIDSHDLKLLQYPTSSEEHVPLSSQRGPTPSLVDTNLDTSSPDTYRPPPAPMPYDVAIGRPHSPPVTQEICVDKTGSAAAQTTNSDSVQEAGGGNVQDPSAKCEDLKESDCKGQANFELDAPKEVEVELSKSVESVVLMTEEEDACPICLEGSFLMHCHFILYPVVPLNTTAYIEFFAILYMLAFY